MRYTSVALGLLATILWIAQISALNAQESADGQSVQVAATVLALSRSVSPEVVRQLVNLFTSADYFTLFDRYDARASDAPAFETSISFESKSKSVLEDVGVYAGMPEIVRTVEDGIDRLAGPKVWVKEKRRTPNVGVGCQSQHRIFHP